jgi:thioredoxin 1
MFRNLFTILLLIIFHFSALTQNPSAIQVSSQEFNQLISENEGVLLDVRTEREFKNGHIEDAGQLNFYSRSFRRSLLLLPKDQPIYLYCNTGWRSDIAASFLIRNGYTRVYNLENGIMEWEQANLPVTVAPDAQPETEDRFDVAEFNELIEREQLVFIDFYAPWCGPCRQMMPMIDKLSTKYEGKIEIVKINADASKSLMRDLEMITVPYLVLYRNGEILFEHKGLIEEQELMALFDSYYNNWEK